MKFTVFHFPILESTNDKALALLEEGGEEGIVVIADQQTAGRGRYGRHWISEKGNFYSSFIVRPKKPLERLSELAFVAAIAVGRLLEELIDSGNVELHYKWPNDVLLNQKKVCGILIESYSTGQSAIPEGCVIGIGINIASNPEFTVFPSSFINHYSRHPITRDQVLDGILGHFQSVYLHWLQQGFAGIRQELLQKIYGLGKNIHTTTPKGLIQGIFEGLTDDGGVIVRTIGGDCMTIKSSEIIFSPQNS
jgi:BirA family transcriptional regulator, biotin operon repressor / biotin---[acetyl-CoA-carboxylase] ligase